MIQAISLTPYSTLEEAVSYIESANYERIYKKRITIRGDATIATFSDEESKLSLIFSINTNRLVGVKQKFYERNYKEQLL